MARRGEGYFEGFFTTFTISFTECASTIACGCQTRSPNQLVTVRSGMRNTPLRFEFSPHAVVLLGQDVSGFWQDTILPSRDTDKPSALPGGTMHDPTATDRAPLYSCASRITP